MLLPGAIRREDWAVLLLSGSGTEEKKACISFVTSGRGAGCVRLFVSFFSFFFRGVLGVAWDSGAEVMIVLDFDVWEW